MKLRDEFYWLTSVQFGVVKHARNRRQGSNWCNSQWYVAQAYAW